jgi:hypothetical protein
MPILYVAYTKNLNHTGTPIDSPGQRVSKLPDDVKFSEWNEKRKVSISNINMRPWDDYSIEIDGITNPLDQDDVFKAGYTFFNNIEEVTNFINENTVPPEYIEKINNYQETNAFEHKQTFYNVDSVTSPIKILNVLDIDTSNLYTM